MKEYLVHIEIEDKDNSHTLIFRSSALAVLFLAIDDFRNTISNIQVSDKSMVTDAQSILQSLSTNFERQLTTVEEQDQLNEGEASSIMKNRVKKEIDDEQKEEDEYFAARGRQGPQLKIAFPGAE